MVYINRSINRLTLMGDFAIIAGLVKTYSIHKEIESNR